jgi:hypothetical protein
LPTLSARSILLNLFEIEFAGQQDARPATLEMYRLATLEVEHVVQSERFRQGTVAGTE